MIRGLKFNTRKNVYMKFKTSKGATKDKYKIRPLWLRLRQDEILSDVFYNLNDEW